VKALALQVDCDSGLLVPASTHGYVEIDMKMKRKALQAAQPPNVKKQKRRSRWTKPNVLQWLDELSKASGNHVQFSAGFAFPRPLPART
jgi:hypothetical protein